MTVRIGTTDVSVLRQVLHEQHYDVPLPVAPRFILDAGANIGLSSVFFANRYPGAAIVAVEPEGSNFRLLTHNSRPYRNIFPLHAALWSRAGELVLTDPGSGHHGFRTREAHTKAHTQGRRVAAVTISEIVRRMGWPAIDLLKIDIEGAEKAVFNAGASWMALVSAILVELHDSIEPGCRQAYETITQDFDYRAQRGETEMAWRHHRLRPGN